MFGALRRCPVTLSRGFSTATLTSRALRSSLPQAINASRILSSQFAKTSVARLHNTAKWQNLASPAEAEEIIAEDGPATEFRQLASRGLVHPNVVRTIVSQMRLTNMTDVQTRTINEALSGVDIIAQARTGTGKTLGFLIPVIQRIIQNTPQLGEKPRGYKRATAEDIRAIVISPTRELAEQIAVEARKLVSNTGLVVQTAVGGTMKRQMLQRTQREGCHLLIGTPGRLRDILSDPYSGVKAPKLNALVMDEADRLLDDGFTAEIDEIKQYLPDPAEVERQNLMFSATVPRDVVDLVRKTMRPGFHFAKCIDENEAPTHERVPQKFVALAGFENIMPALYEFAIQQHRLSQAGDTRPFKAIIYFNSTSEVKLASSVLYKLSGGFKRNTALSGLRGYEIHSKLSQSQRTRAADDFRACKSGMLFSSDVTARGMDFPDVTHVIQIGLPKDRDTYIHRIGRTGRAGKEGEGWLFLTPLEEQEARRRLHGLPLTEATNQLETASVDMSEAAELPENVGRILTDVVEAHKKVYPDELEDAFRGLFGGYMWYGDRQHLLESANRLAEFGWGMPTPPQPPSSFYQVSNRRSRGGGRSFGGRPGGGFGGRQGGGFNDRQGGGFGDRQGGGSGGRGRDFNSDRKPRDGGFGRSGGFGGDRKPREGGFGGRGRGGFGSDRGDRGGFGGDRGNRRQQDPFASPY